METILNLLADNGIVYMEFRPSLTAAQYAELLRIQKAAKSQEDMRRIVAEWAARVSVNVSFDERPPQ